MRLRFWVWMCVLCFSFLSVSWADQASKENEKSAEALEKEYSRIKELYSTKHVSGEEKELEYNRVKQLYMDQQASVAYSQERPQIQAPSPNQEPLPQPPVVSPSDLEFGKAEFRKQINQLAESKKTIRPLRGQIKTLNSQIRDARERISQDIDDIDRLTNEIEKRQSALSGLNRVATDLGRGMQYFIFGMGSFEDRVIERAQKLMSRQGVLPQEEQKFVLWIQEIKEQRQIRSKAEEELKQKETELSGELEKTKDVQKPIPFTSASMGNITEEPPKPILPGYRSGS